MNTRQCAFSVVCGLTVMTVIGCYSHYPTSVYGPGGGYGVPPAGAYPPAGTYGAPGGGAAPGTIYQPQSPVGSSESRWQPGGGDAPAFNSGQSGASTGGENLVPQPYEPEGLSGGPAPEFGDGGFDDTQDFGAPAGSAAPRAPDPMGSLGPADDNSSPFGEANSEPDDLGPPAETKVSLTPVSTVRTVAEYSSTSAGSSPYKYDTENFAWVRGVVDYNEPAGTWNIIYDIEPDSDDPYGGSIVLLGGKSLDSLKTGAVALVEGKVDPQQLDAFGKPTFRVERLVRLQPAE